LWDYDQDVFNFFRLLKLLEEIMGEKENKVSYTFEETGYSLLNI
jgi:hypothetical protein